MNFGGFEKNRGLLTRNLRFASAIDGCLSRTHGLAYGYTSNVYESGNTATAALNKATNAYVKATITRFLLIVL